MDCRFPSGSVSCRLFSCDEPMSMSNVWRSSLIVTAAVGLLLAAVALSLLVGEIPIRAATIRDACSSTTPNSRNT